MKNHLPSFLSGVIVATLAFSVGATALAATGQLTITVDPVNIQVNGQTFQPTDAKGKDVPVFAYQGTTYAPLRALAEAYGLEVGYDAASNMATVTGDTKAADTPTPDTTAPANDYSDWSAEEEAAYKEFKGMWKITDNAGEGINGITIIAELMNTASDTEFVNYLETIGNDLWLNMANRFVQDTLLNYNTYSNVYFGFSKDSRIFAGVMARQEHFPDNNFTVAIPEIEKMFVAS